jgi:hypothetical protein
MAELVEYSLAVMVSFLFVAGSVATYASFSTFESGIQLRAAYGAVSALASQAIENGSARRTLSLPSSTISCHGGSLTLSSGPLTERQSMPAACDFVVNVSAGSHLLHFYEESSQLLLSVT